MGFFKASPNGACCQFETLTRWIQIPSWVLDLDRACQLYRSYLLSGSLMFSQGCTTVLRSLQRVLGFPHLSSGISASFWWKYQYHQRRFLAGILSWHSWFLWCAWCCFFINKISTAIKCTYGDTTSPWGTCTCETNYRWPWGNQSGEWVIQFSSCLCSL